MATPSFDSQQVLASSSTQTSKQEPFHAIFGGVLPSLTNEVVVAKLPSIIAVTPEKLSEKSVKPIGESMRENHEDLKSTNEIPINRQTPSPGYGLGGPVPNVNPSLSSEENVKVAIDEVEMESIRLMLLRDHATLVVKGREYGPSWKQRGGVGAFMMMARKWDRIENQVKRENWDIFTCVQKNPLESGILDDIGDLRRYLALVEDHVRKELRKAGKL